MLRGFVRGFGHGLTGLRWLRSQPSLRRYWVPPVLLTVVVFVALQGAAIAYFDDLLAALWAPPGGAEGCGGASEGWWCWGAAGLYWLAGLLSWLVAATLALLSSFVVSVVLSAPFHDALSEATERLEGHQPPAAFDPLSMARDALRSIALELLKWLGLAALLGPLWIVSWLVPGVGQVLYAGASGLLAAAYFALDFTDWPASRRGWGIGRRVQLLRDHPGPALGFGASVALLLFVPVLSLGLVPAAVIGGTRLFLELEGGDPGPAPR